jgi:ribonucleoside-diphosphate reductase alpha chain
VVLDLDHPEIMDFINWKVKEEDKVAALIAAGYASDYEGEAYLTVSGQNSNNSVRIPNEFFEALATGGDWQTTARTTGQVMKTYKAQAIWDAIAQAAWRCADPGLQYHTTINQWHTCPVDGPIRASNPCSEYMFLDNTACNLASVNLRKFFDLQTCTLDVEGYRHACRLWTIVLEISVLMAHFPSKEIAQLSYEFRTLGLGYANLGSVLMVAGIPYDSPEATAICGAITALMTGTSYATSAEMAEILGPFSGYERNKEHMLRVMRNHRLAAYNAPKSDYDNLTVTPVGIDPKYCPDYLLRAATSAWDDALQRGEQHGYRNAQTTVLAPTGTIGLLMDCDTTGVEPDFALVKFKKLAGGGYFKIINQSIPPAMANLGYNELQQKAIYAYVMGHATLDGAPYINPASLKAKGLTDQDIQKLNAALGSAFQIDFAFNQWTLGEETLQRLGFKPEQYNAAGFNLLRAMGYSRAEIEAANEYVCGTQTIEGAPHLRPEHYPVFDCANKCGTKGTRFIHPHGHIRMMAAAQPFISGAISKTINFPHETQWEEVQDSYKISWELGLKALSIYRDGSKLSQPLSTKSDVKDDDAVADALVTANAVATAETEAQAQALLAEAQAKLAKAEQEVQELLALSQEKLLERVRKLIATPEGTELQRELRRLVSRRPMPSKRYGFTQKASVGGQAIYVRTGEYEDGTLGELFIDMHKEGATMRSLMNSFAIAVSIGLQYGVPLEEFVDKFSFTRFEPAGPVADHPNIKYATSLVDYIFRLLAFEYLNREDLVQVKPSDLKPASPTATEHYQQHAALANAPTEAEPEAAAKKKTSRTIGVIPRVVGDIGENGEALADEPTITNSDSGNPVPRLRVVTRSAGLAPQTQSAIAGVSTLSAAASLAANPGLAPQISADAAQRSVEATQEFLGNLMGDAPACNVCGHITIRNGTCYRCLNCGNSMGCS